MKKSYLMRRPDDDDDYNAKESVRAKPIRESFAKKLGCAYQGKDFVKASDKSQKDFYGTQTILGDVPSTSRTANEATASADTTMAGNFRPLTHDERNKISAKIIKAELKGDKQLVKKLKLKLEFGVVDDGTAGGGAPTGGPPDDKTVVLMRMDAKTGLVRPAESKKPNSLAGDGSVKQTVENVFRRTAGLDEMVADEKRTSAHDQLTMFGRAAKMCTENAVDDDWVVDDNIMSHPVKRRHAEKDAGKSAAKRVKEHKRMENTLDTCRRCVDSRHLSKHAIVAMGLKTYLAVVAWEGLSDEHCYVAPMAHYASQVLLDEDVYEEMRLWFKGLSAMWQRVNDDPNDGEEPEDCVFFENAKHVNQHGHMTVECVPLPREVGDLAPIYFKKAILDSEKEWSDNQKLIDLSKTSGGCGVRRAIPKGFPYFAVDFGLQPGYAHVIEHDELFPDNFAHEIIGGMLDLPYKTWHNVRQLSLNEIKAKRDRFRERWRPYDWTERVKAVLRGADGE